MVQQLSNISPTGKCQAGGFCTACNTIHVLGMGTAMRSARDLIARLNNAQTIDLFSKKHTRDDSLSTEPLWGEPRGKMFGVMDCLTKDDTITTLYAFSGQYSGRWLVDGWVPPLFDVAQFNTMSCSVEKEIKTLGRKIETSNTHSEGWLLLRKKRRLLSRTLMKEIHGLYELTNFKGETASLTEVYYGSDKIPTGTGDCCAPKLLNYAAKSGLTPTGICEFFFGKETKSGSHTHGQFSSSCAEKCAPILGFMLCGLKSL